MAPKRRKPTASGKQVKPKKAKIDDCTLSWIESVEKYVKETGTNVLDLANRGLRKDAIRAILNILPDSQVTNLNLEENHFLSDGIADFGPLLVKTKVRKLRVAEKIDRAKGVLKLLRVLKDSQITSLSLKLSGYFYMNFVDAKKCIIHLKKSELITLDTNIFCHISPIDQASFLQDYLSTSVTCFSLKGESRNCPNDITSVLSNLGRSSVTDLDVVHFHAMSSKILEELSQRLDTTKIKKLNLSWNGLKDEQLSILVTGLVNSKVSDLNLSVNHFSSLNPLFSKLKETQIKKLDFSNNDLRYEKAVYADCLRCSSLTSLSLSSCRLSDEFGQDLMNNLRFSNVAELDISQNSMGLLTVRKFAENVKDIIISDLDISFNLLPLNAFFILGKCSRESKLTSICVRGITSKPRLEASHLLSFLKLTGGSSICHIDLSFNDYIWNPQAVGEPQMLANTLTELRLCRSNIGGNVSNVVTFLKFTAVTYLDLSYNVITDDGAMVLAESLRDTQIRRLNLQRSKISSEGAKALALSLKDTNLLYLHLNSNNIGDDGLEFLAENAENTFVSVIDVLDNPGKKVLLIDKVLWQNKISVHKLVHTFKQITSKTNGFCFNQNSDDLDVSAFLEKCMWLYRIITHEPRSVNVLLEEEEITFSKEQIFRLVFEEFPRQFSDFVACRVEANVTEHMAILEKAEEMSLTAVVESLLLNRPVYMLDEEQGILHPRVYKLLLKYKQPVCNLAVEPLGVVKIIQYFTEHTDVDGAQDVVNLLQNVYTL